VRLRIELAALVLSLGSAATVLSQGQNQGGFVAYPQRPPGDPSAIERGKGLYGANCTFCHGVDARGGDGGGPNQSVAAASVGFSKGETN